MKPLIKTEKKRIVENQFGFILGKSI